MFALPLSPQLLAWARRWWSRDVCAAFLVALALYVIKEWYPFTHFPMYSRLEPSATVVFVTDQENRPISLKRAFGYASSNAKKSFNARLEKAAAKHGRRWTENHPDDWAEAGKEMLEFFAERKDDRFLKGVSELRFNLRVLEWKNGQFVETNHQLATRPFSL